MKVSETLNKAADLIQRDGWTQGDEGWFRKQGQPLCLEGAIQAALGIRPYDTDDDDELEAWFGPCPSKQAVRDYLEHERALYRWNDQQGRTQEEVVAVLRAAAAIEAVKEETVAQDARWQPCA